MASERNRSTEVEMLYAALGSRDEEKRYQALLEALSLSEAQLRELVATAKRRDPQFRRRFGAISCLATGSILAALFAPAGPMTVVGPLCITGWWFLFWVKRRPLEYWQDENMLRVLRSAPVGCCVEAVLWMLEKPQGERCERLLALLKERLPELQSADAEEWTQKQKDILLLILRSWHRHPDLACTLLQAMPVIGGRWALETVERLAKLKSWNPARLRTTYRKVRQESLPWPEEVRKGRQPTEREVEEMLAEFGRIGCAATECLPGLWERIQDEADAHILLRPSALDDAPAQLLRPVRAEEALSTNLLRAGSTPVRSAEENV